MRHLIILISISVLLVGAAFAQSGSYEDRLSRIGNQKMNPSLGTLSGQNKEEAQKRELYDSYTYVPNSTLTEQQYIEFKKNHDIPEYIGDASLKTLIQSTKDEAVKTEGVKIFEAETLLHESYQAYQEGKSKVKEEKLEKDMTTRIDIIAKQSSSFLQSSIQKLSDKNVQYMASGGRAFPKLELEEEKDILNLRSSVIEHVQQELLKVMAQAINQYYHREQGETARVEITSKSQLLAFVKVEDKAEQRKFQADLTSGHSDGKSEVGQSKENTPGIGQKLYRVGPPPPSGWMDDNRAPTGQNQLTLDHQSGKEPPGGWQQDNRPGTGQSEYRQGPPPPGGWSN